MRDVIYDPVDELIQVKDGGDLLRRFLQLQQVFHLPNVQCADCYRIKIGCSRASCHGHPPGRKIVRRLLGYEMRQGVSKILFPASMKRVLQLAPDVV